MTTRPGKGVPAPPCQAGKGTHSPAPDRHMPLAEGPPPAIFKQPPLDKSCWVAPASAYAQARSDWPHEQRPPAQQPNQRGRDGPAGGVAASPGGAAIRRGSGNKCSGTTTARAARAPHLLLQPFLRRRRELQVPGMPRTDRLQLSRAVSARPP